MTYFVGIAYIFFKQICLAVNHLWIVMTNELNNLENLDCFPSNVICGRGSFVYSDCRIVVGGSDRFSGELCINVFSADSKIEESVLNLLDKLGYKITDKKNW